MNLPAEKLAQEAATTSNAHSSDTCHYDVMLATRPAT